MGAVVMDEPAQRIFQDGKELETSESAVVV